ncbi:MAG: polyprenyl synthetase family protein [Myxococcota bacterium]
MSATILSRVPPTLARPTAASGTKKRQPTNDWLAIVRAEVNALLEEFFSKKHREVMDVSPPTVELVSEIAALTMRGGKRLRPAVAAAGYRCIRPGHGMERVVELGAALELLQSYLLIHDDWMDDDDERRGGKAVHKSLRDRHENGHLGDALGILAGDLASTYAWELFLEAPYPVRAWADAQRAFLDIQKQVYCGQQLDLTGDADVSRMHGLKTTSYSVRGPVVLGALLGDPSEDQLHALAAWAGPIGEAFQIRDDLLGTLGSAADTGKPGLDLVHGKLGSVIAELRRSTEPAERSRVEAVFGNSDASAGELAAAQMCLHETGIVQRLEQRIETLRADAAGHLANDLFNPQGREMLTELSDKLTVRRA